MGDVKGNKRITLKDLKVLAENLPENTIISIELILEDEDAEEERK